MPELLLGLRLLIALVLYAFLGLVLYVLWRDLQRQGEDELTEPPSAVLEGERGYAGRLALRTVTALGRAADNHLILEDPFASAYHALLFWREGTWWLEDLGSHNGTLLNGEPLNNGPSRLVQGDQIRIGETVLRFEPRN